MPQKVLDYHDVLLYDSDLGLLEDEEWLNDQVISFYFEYLSREKSRSCGFTFVPGATTFLLINAGSEDAAAVVEALQLKEQKVIFLAVNDNPDVSTACGGSHWSLLVLDLNSSEARHYDSARGANAGVAAELLQKLQAALRLDAGAKLVTAASPQQQNGYDCGVYVLAMADLICDARARGLDWAGVDAELQRALPPGAASQWRSAVLALAHELAGKGKVRC
ncbi:hypothetical protein WJX81_000421 [Elliptochloris bilobata]|uniref:Ubiquitin-like protease family profile domain-containing protein n=1 Tax=Elliptochloris bilobata TaxID=381761 RepID=A0AAW1RU96_9CHLO